jgi:hypothetical protein
LEGKDKHVFGRFSTGTLEKPKEHACKLLSWRVTEPSKTKERKASFFANRPFPQKDLLDILRTFAKIQVIKEDPPMRNGKRLDRV